MLFNTDIDLAWLEAQALNVLEKNRITELRTWNQISQECTYHAPSLFKRMGYPAWFSRKLKFLWKLWWQFKLPFQVRYPHQWFWDSCAHTIVLSHLNSEIAQKEIKSLLYAQSEDGFIPQMIWNPQEMHWLDKVASKWLYPSSYFSPYLQPPVLAEAVEAVYDSYKDVDFVNAVLPS